MIARLALAASLFAIAPALAQEATPPAAGGAPKPYVPPNAPAVGEAPPVAGAVGDVPAPDPEAQRAAEALPTQVEDVQVVGPWTDGEATGVWRTVMMQVGEADKEVYRFFVQKVDRVGVGAKIVSTTEVREVAGVNGTVVGYRAEEPEDGAAATDLTLFFDVVPTTGEIAETYELHFMKDLTYTFGPASN